jgi:hypothetical protein
MFKSRVMTGILKRLSVGLTRLNRKKITTDGTDSQDHCQNDKTRVLTLERRISTGFHFPQMFAD